MLYYSLAAEERYLTDKINCVEKHFSALAINVAAVARKTARLRDKGDVLAKGINEYADCEPTAMGQKLKAVGECLAAMEDFRQAEVRHLWLNIILQLCHCRLID